MTQHLYRFRSCHALLDGFGELEAQEIYFASPDQLNDPMEGFRDLFWHGDTVVWRNLLRHYARGLTIAAGFARLMGDELSVPRCFDHVYASDTNPPTPALREACEGVAEAFLRLPHIEELADELGRRSDPVRADELGFILRGVHIDALKLAAQSPVSGFAQEANFHAALERALPALPFSLRKLSQGRPADERVIDMIYGTSDDLALQMRLISLLERSGRADQAISTFLLIDFPRNYVTSLERLLYPDTCTACFTATPSNAAMWGVYGDSHRGVCLKFGAGVDPARPSLGLYQPVGIAGRKGAESEIVYDWVQRPAPPVEYAESYPEMSFFASLGRVPMGVLHRDWLSDPDHGTSPIAGQLRDEEAEWRAGYWRAFEQSNLLKTRHWAHEAEHRVVYSSNIHDLSDSALRKLKYRFSDLQGIYFGARAADRDILRILHIIQRKCAGEKRRAFELYRAAYARTTGEMEFHRLSLVEKALFG